MVVVRIEEEVRRWCSWHCRLLVILERRQVEARTVEEVRRSFVVGLGLAEGSSYVVGYRWVVVRIAVALPTISGCSFHYGAVRRTLTRWRSCQILSMSCCSGGGLVGLRGKYGVWFEAIFAIAPSQLPQVAPNYPIIEA